MKRSAKLMIAGGAAAAGAAALSAAAYATTRVLVKVALDREQPRLPNMERARRRLRGTAGSREFFQYMADCRAQLEALPHKAVELHSFDGKRLVGHWYPHPQPKRLILAMHGWRSSWASDFGMISKFWRDRGCSVLYAEQRAQGGSEGEYMGFGMLERYDCQQWAQWLADQLPGQLPIYLAGVSMGAATVLMASDLRLPDRVCGIMADCGFTSAQEIWKHVASRNLHMPYSFHGSAAQRLCRGRIQMGPKDWSTLRSLEKTKLPVLLYHGARDHFVPVEMTYQNYSACAGPKQLMIVPDADHGMSYYLEKERYEQEMLKFWEKFDSFYQNNEGSC